MSTQQQRREKWDAMRSTYVVYSLIYGSLLSVKAQNSFGEIAEFDTDFAEDPKLYLGAELKIEDVRQNKKYENQTESGFYNKADT